MQLLLSSWALLVLCVHPAAADLASALDEIVSRESLAQGHVGIAVYDIEAGVWLYEHDADKLFVPASVFKLVTCAYALERLGPDATLTTRIVARAKASAKGVVRGDLVLVGGGDPFSDEAAYIDLADQCYAEGVRDVRGDLVVDTSRFDPHGVATGWAVDDLEYPYGAVPGALNVGRQRLSLTITPTEAGKSATITWAPEQACITLARLCITGPPGADASVSVDKAVGRADYTVRGSVSEGGEPFVIDSTIEDADIVAGRIVAARLMELGVALGLVRRGAGPDRPVVLAERASEPVSEIVRRVLKHSDNLAAELLLWNAAVERDGAHSFDQADLAMYDWLGARGLPVDGLRTADGSGLSRYALLTPRFMCALLAMMREGTHGGAYYDALPIAGEDGTLALRFADSPAKGIVHAKTGWMSRVISLAGYVRRPDGREVCFVAFQNAVSCPNSEALAIRDEIAEVIATEP